MSLRVLLADESLTIKKVMDLALQDYLVQVKAVPSGLDVLDVALDFKPEIIFIDVLLAKKSGYEVAAELRKHENLKNTPVVLMWSGFIEVDQKKVEAAGASTTLEKPFDAEQLRKIVRDFVPRLKSNRISEYLNFSDLPPLVEETEDVSTPMSEDSSGEKLELLDLGAFGGSPSSSTNTPSTQGMQLRSSLRKSEDEATQIIHQEIPSKSFEDPSSASQIEQAPSSFAAVEEFDDFQTVPLPGTKRKDALSDALNPEASSKGADLLEGWEPKKIHELKEEISTSSPLTERISAAIQTQTTKAFEQAPFDDDSNFKGAILLSDTGDEVDIESLDDQTPIPDHLKTKRSQQTGPAPSLSALDPVRVEEILREQVSRTIEDIAWKIIPDVAERIIKQEIQRLMDELDQLKKRN